MKNLALIVAAGKGKRLGSEIPKQYLPLDGEALLVHSVRAFAQHPDIDAVQVVIAEGDEQLYYKAISPIIDSGTHKLLDFIIGGAERQDSVKQGLESAKMFKPTNVLIHDAARPYISSEIITRILEGLKTHYAAIPYISCKDSARYNGKALDRKQLQLVQTPQGFNFQAIYAAHQKAAPGYTDDAQVAESTGMDIFMVEGDEMNTKITTEADFKKPASFRVGTGFDVHEFETGTHVNICGVKILHSHQLKGHSDADVGLHALTDALLGAIGAGDIGEHFPPSDVRWKDADSTMFVRHALKHVIEKKGQVENVDITIICEEPKLTPHKPEMKKKVAEILKIPADCVNIKATTTEKLGFTGRKEGIAAQAVATIKFLG